MRLRDGDGEELESDPGKDRGIALFRASHRAGGDRVERADLYGRRRICVRQDRYANNHVGQITDVPLTCSTARKQSL